MKRQIIRRHISSDLFLQLPLQSFHTSLDRYSLAPHPKTGHDNIQIGKPPSSDQSYSLPPTPGRQSRLESPSIDPFIKHFQASSPRQRSLGLHLRQAPVKSAIFNQIPASKPITPFPLLYESFPWDPPSRKTFHPSQTTHGALVAPLLSTPLLDRSHAHAPRFHHIYSTRTNTPSRLPFDIRLVAPLPHISSFRNVYQQFNSTRFPNSSPRRIQ